MAAKKETADCPSCGEVRPLTKNGRIVNHKGDGKKKGTIGRGKGICSGSGTAAWTDEQSLDWPTEEDILTAVEDADLEAAARHAIYRASSAWRFIHGQHPNEEFERAIRALVLAGADSTLIVGAITIAAMKSRLTYDAQWSYSCGIVRNELRSRALQ